MGIVPLRPRSPQAQGRRGVFRELVRESSWWRWRRAGPSSHPEAPARRGDGNSAPLWSSTSSDQVVAG